MSNEAETIWFDWNADKTAGNTVKLLDQFRPMINREVARQSGDLPPSYLEAKAKSIAVDAFKTFDPLKGAKLSTHVANRMKGLARENFTYQNALRTPEDRQRKFRLYSDIKDKLTERLGREPSAGEMAEKLKWPEREAARMERDIHKEKPVYGGGHNEAISGFNEPVVDFIYHDMLPEEKVLFESFTGYNGHPVLETAEIAKMLNLSESQLKRRKKKLVDSIEKKLGKT